MGAQRRSPPADELNGPGAGLRPLSELGGYEVAEGYVDVRGFELRDERGQAIGEVEELLVDPASGWVRYLVVDVDADAVSGMTNVEEVRIPTEAVEVLAEEQAVRLKRPIGVFAPGLASGGPLEVPAREARGGPAPLTDPAPGRPGLVIEPGPGGDIVGTRARAVPSESHADAGAEGRVRIRRRDQPIVRGPAVQGQGPQERHETTDAGKGAARTVEGPGRQGPEEAAHIPSGEVGTGVPPGPEDVEARRRPPGA